MQVDIEKLPKSKIKVKISLSGGEFSPYLVSARQELSKNFDIPGFRPGKAPQKILEEHVGNEKILEEGANIALNKIFQKMVVEKNLKILGRAEGRIAKISSEELEGEIETAILPEVGLPDYKKIALLEPRKGIKVEKKEVDDSILRLRKSRAKFVRKPHSAVEGDQVEVDYEIRNGGVKVENGDIKGQKIILGEGKFIHGFEEKLIGIKEKEERSFSLSVPPDFWKKEFREKILDFKVKVKGVFKVEIPELVDDFAKSLGKFENKDQLQKSILKGIKIEKERKEKNRRQDLILEKIAKEADIDLPDVLIIEERNKMVEDFKKNIEEMGASFDEYLSRLKKNPEELKNDLVPEAERRIRIILCIYEIAKKESIKVSQEELEKNINKILKETPQFVKRLSGSEGENIKNYLRENILQKKVIEFLSASEEKH